MKVEVYKKIISKDIFLNIDIYNEESKKMSIIYWMQLFIVSIYLLINWIINNK